MCAYGPVNDRSEEEKARFWNRLKSVVDDIGNGYRVIVMGDLNGWIGDQERAGVTGLHGVPGVNENGERVVDFCAEKEFCVGNTFFKHKDIHKYTRVGQSRNGEVRSMIDLVLFKRNMLKDVCDVKCIRGLSGGLSDHMIVLCKLRVIGTWMRRQEKASEGKRIRSEKLQNEDIRKRFEQLIEVKKREVDEDLDVEGCWNQMKNAITVSAREVCGCAKTGKRAKGSEWWSDEIKVKVAMKERVYMRMLQATNEHEKSRLKEEYKVIKKDVKKMVKRSKKEVNERLGNKMKEDLNGNLKLFWKEVRKINGSDRNTSSRVKDREGKILIGECRARERWREYFMDLLNVTQDMEMNVNMCGFAGVRRSTYLGCEPISMDEVSKVIVKLKNGKASGVDEVTAEMIKSGGESLKRWVWSMCVKVFESGIVPNDWKNAVIVPLYKGKGEKGECKNYRGISLLSVVGKVYASILAERVRKITESLMDDEQGGFRKGRGCVDQIFALKQVCEKVREKGGKVYLGFMDLEKAYDRVNREALWQVLRMYGVSGKLLNGIKSMYDGSKACVRVNGSLSEWFDIDSGVRQGCVMSPWLFNVFMDGVMKEVRMRINGMGIGLERDGIEWTLSDLMYADDVVFMAKSERELSVMIQNFDYVCKRRGLKVNVDKSKVMIVGENVDHACEVRMNGHVLERVNDFKYLGSVVNDRGTDVDDCNARVASGRKVAGAIRLLVNERNLNMSCVNVLHEKLLVPVLMYGSECQVWKEKERSRVRAVQMDNLRGMLGVKRIDRMRNERIRELCNVRKGVDEIIDENVLRWYGHVERMDDERIVRKVFKSECVGVRAIGRPRKRWIDSARECMNKRGIGPREAERLVHDRSAWRRCVRGNAWGLARGMNPD